MTLGRERDQPTATRMLAIANALEGMNNAEAARFAGLERQALRDSVQRFNAELLNVPCAISPRRPVRWR